MAKDISMISMEQAEYSIFKGLQKEIQERKADPVVPSQGEPIIGALQRSCYLC